MSGAVITGAVILSVGAYLGYSMRKKRLAIEEYNFNNRTEGGVVQYENFKDAKRQETLYRVFHKLENAGWVLLTIGFIILAVVLSK